MSVTLFAGCSYTSGFGWEFESQDSNLWTNILHANNKHLCKTKQLNVGISGGSNSDIFQAAISGLLDHTPKYAFVQWTSYPRYRVGLGVKTYSTNQLFASNDECRDHGLHGITYTKDYLVKIRDRFISLHNPHFDILHIVKYTNSLIKLANRINTKIFFINGICHWDKNFFEILNDVLPSSYSKYTRNMLNSDTRDDEETYTLYNKIHTDYSQAGGIQQDYWINLYQSFRSLRIDTNSDNIHPGKQSNILYSDIINQALNNKLSS
jgi:hypothetical protein